MLCVNKYLQDYISNCRKNIAIQLKSYKKVRSRLTDAGTEEKIIEDFEQSFFNHLILALEAYFMHRSRTLELKDGNAANEVRMLSNSIMCNGNILQPDNTIKYNPPKAILKYNFGDKIKLTVEDFSKLSDAYFKEIEKKFSY